MRKVCRTFYTRKFGMILLVAPQPTVLWYKAFHGTTLVSHVSVLKVWNCSSRILRPANAALPMLFAYALCQNLCSTDGSEYVATISLSSHQMGRIRPGHLSERQD